MIWIGEGARRECFDLGDGSVLKRVRSDLSFGKRDLSCREIKAEVDVWNTLVKYNHKDKKWFLPVLDHCPNYSWLKMPRGFKITRYNMPTDTGITWVDDIVKPSNWVIIDGEFKICDYGRTTALNNLLANIKGSLNGS